MKMTNQEVLNMVELFSSQITALKEQLDNLKLENEGYIYMLERQRERELSYQEGTLHQIRGEQNAI